MTINNCFFLLYSRSFNECEAFIDQIKPRFWVLSP